MYKKRTQIIIICLLILFTFGASDLHAQRVLDVSQQAAELLKKNKVSSVYKMFSPEFKKKISKKKLKKSWGRLVKQNGSVTEILKSDTINYESASTTILLEKVMLNLMISVNQKGQISSINMLPLKYSPPKSTLNKGYGKKMIEVVTDTFSMDGEVVYPLNCTSCPIVILVHGSGCLDMDEAAYGLATFNDLALMFAQRGIATLRYNKRCNEYPESTSKKQPWTLDDETVDDAISALILAKGLENIDTNNIYLIGHSLGAYAAPRIAARYDGPLAGIIMMAGPSRPLYEVLEDQVLAAFYADNKLTFVEKRSLKIFQKEVELLRSKKFEEIKQVKYVGYWPKSFFEDVANYDIISTLDTVKCRVLVTQGTRDFQVSDSLDYLPMAVKLANNSNVDFKLFDGLNHFYIWGSAPSQMMEYFEPSNVEEYVVDDFAKWIFNKQ